MRDCTFLFLVLILKNNVIIIYFWKDVVKEGEM